MTLTDKYVYVYDAALVPYNSRSFAPSPRMNGEVPRRFAGRSPAKQRISGYGHGTLT